MRMTRLYRAGAIALPVVCTLLLSSAAPCQQQASTAPVEYVAMGSSYAAGPGIGTRAPGSRAQCAQSSENYAHLFARKRGLKLIDVSCSGATTESILKTWRSLPPQMQAVTPKTRLVTVTIGGNDVFFMANLFAWSCQNAPHRASQTRRAAMCRATPDADLEAAFETLPGNFRKIVAGIHQRAPSAIIVFVDYVTLLPETGACPDKLPLSQDELEKSRSVAYRLAAITQTVANQTGSDLLKASDLTKEHDVCSSDAWVNGFQFAGAPSAFAPVPYHPTAQSMQAVADALDRMLPQF
ncbi:MAG TPA: SGNH/GDSL hydrolase family protein [Candidatus Acidoferrales bacterium]